MDNNSFNNNNPDSHQQKDSKAKKIVAIILIIVIIILSCAIGFAVYINKKNDEKQKDALKKAVEDYTTKQLLEFYYDDYDADGKKEAFAIAGDGDKDSFKQADIIYVDRKKKPKTVDSNIDGHTNGIIKDNKTKFVSVEKEAEKAEDNRSYIYGVKEKDTYQPEISGEYQNVHQEGNDIVAEDPATSETLVLTFSADTGELVANNDADTTQIAADEEKLYYEYIRDNLEVKEFVYRLDYGTISALIKNLDDDPLKEMVTFTISSDSDGSNDDFFNNDITMQLYKIIEGKVTLCDTSEKISIRAAGEFEVHMCAYLDTNVIRIEEDACGFGGSTMGSDYSSFAVENNKIIKLNDYISYDFFRYDTHELSEKVSGKSFTDDEFYEAVKKSGFETGKHGFKHFNYNDTTLDFEYDNIKENHIFALVNDKMLDRYAVYDHTDLMKNIEEKTRELLLSTYWESNIDSNTIYKFMQDDTYVKCTRNDNGKIIVAEDLNQNSKDFSALIEGNHVIIGHRTTDYVAEDLICCTRSSEILMKSADKSVLSKYPDAQMIFFDKSWAPDIGSGNNAYYLVPTK